MSRVRKNYSLDVREQAEILRKEGVSYAEIFKKLAIPKSTLSTWFGEKYGSFMDDPKKRRAHLAKARGLSIVKFAESRKAKELLLKKKVVEMLSDFPSDLHMKRAMLAMLYWAEGAKTDRAGALTFTNTDPLLCRLYIRLVRECFVLDEKKFRIRLHLHHYHPIKETRKFWSQLLNVPLQQFGKIHIKQRSKTKKFRKNFKGICFIIYWDKDLKREVIETGVGIANKILLLPSFNG